MMMVAAIMVPGETIASYRRIKALLSEAGSDRQTTPVEITSGRLAFEAVSFVPPDADKPVLQNINCVVEDGEMLCIIGPSGAGKSTLARLLVGVSQPTGGGVFLDG